ncbi:phenylalanine--tRNA ligase subunit beta [Methylococcus capsulatus]|jgi:phenylalanyl-tRNA synthetase beta chain|uniref:Phenylalanine--tRNA ligase beta subunit n=1 Tax=Methylococcus capsulatus TaxID=414 RepID=A0AA35UGB6_METCP|nr:phenylalanine--tRNA ligase subunit beta [Methylococcus capsulatus]CAI8751064.1 phenylalanine--tRNA ligase subunit beta [Methylococcus capsulatus]
MRLSEAWLRQYVNPMVDTAGLVRQLTMAGLEVDGAEPAAADFSGVVVARILEAAPHPEADRLQICRVDTGGGEPLQIVCGAANARVGLVAPLAMEGAVLPGPLKIKRSRLRGVESFGMLCSAKELGLEDDASGLLELPADAPVGADIRDYLQLDDRILEIDLTPNRADCLSVEGIAREVALINRLPFQGVDAGTVAVGSQRRLVVHLDAPEACPRYLGRVIAGIDARAQTPRWMKERLRRSGLRSLGPAVDVTNYVLLELGQPLHAFDLERLSGDIHVRQARDGELLRLLNGEEITLSSDVLVIADEEKALALAGIMGGEQSAVGGATSDVFLECAFFAPALIMGKARRYGLATDSSHRFERGVDPSLQRRAIERATALLLEIAGGEAGPVTEAVREDLLPLRAPVRLREQRIGQLLGLSLPRDEVADILARLGMSVEEDEPGWTVTPPSFRFDIALEADLIEEIGRVYGYDAIPRRRPAVASAMQPASETVLGLDRVKDLLADRGYQEVITYSFVSAEMQRRIDPEAEPEALLNPISADLAVMRISLWTGLLDCAQKNLSRQQDRVRIFETGLKFVRRGGSLEQRNTLAGLVLGSILDEQWGEKSRRVDFFDVKSDVEAILGLTGKSSVRFRPAIHHALHPGQSAEILIGDGGAGWLGMLHPQIERELGFEQPVFMFELDAGALLQRDLPRFAPLSRFPLVRRDLALVVARDLPAADLLEAVAASGGPLVRDTVLFDVYSGAGVEAGKKSVALGVTLQDAEETLTDDRVDEVMSRIVARLAADFGAKLRE